MAGSVDLYYVRPRPVREPVGSDLILETTEEVRLIQQRIQATYSRQKSYANPKCKHLEFAVGDHAFFKVSPMKGVMRFSRKGKLSLRYIGPFEIIGRVEAVAYELALPPKFASVHPVFHISLLRKYISDSSHVLAPQSVEVRLDLSYDEVLLRIIDRQVKKLWNKEIASVKVIWKYHSVEKATWEVEDEMRHRYPHQSNSVDP